jgi:hypothetical protein
VAAGEFVDLAASNRNPLDLVKRDLVASPDIALKYE